MEQDEIIAMREGLNKPKIEPTIVEPIVEQVKVEPEKVEPIIEAVKVEPAIVEPVKVEAIAEPLKVEPIVEKVKSFEDYLAERTEGKFKKWEDVEQIINTPKQEFANEQIKHWDDLAKKGIKLDREFFELESLNVDSMDDPQEILLETMKRKDDYKGLSEKTLKLQLDKKYNLTEWIEKDESDLTDDDIANREIMIRDARNDKGWLQNFKNERVLVKPLDQNAIADEAEKQRVFQDNWEKYLDNDLLPKVTTLSTMIDENTKEAFEYKISEADSKEFGGMMKLLTKDTNILFSQFAEKDGQGNVQINHRKVLEMLIKNKNYDQAVKNAYNDGKALGAKKEITDLKNINFKATEGRVNTDEPQTEKEAFQQAAAKTGMIF